MNDKISISDYFILLKKEITDKIINDIKWVKNEENNFYVFNYNGLVFSKSLNDDDPNYCYLNYNVHSQNPNQIFETKNCLIAYIITFLY